MPHITLNIAQITDLDTEFLTALNLGPFALYSQTQVWTWSGGGCAVVGITPTRGPRIEGWCLYRISKSNPIRSRVGFSGVAIGAILTSNGFESTVADPNPGFVYEDSSPAEVLATLCGH
jgi:hypothetical protein